MTRLETLQKTGIRRVGRKGAFRYVAADRSKVDRADVARIKALRIPPAWKHVVINRAAGGMLQAAGKDAAGRWQYLYHEQQVRKREKKRRRSSRGSFTSARRCLSFVESSLPI
jgi:DNA topoisomerase-1